MFYNQFTKKIFELSYTFQVKIIFIAIPKAEMHWAYNSLIFKLTFPPPALEIQGQNSHSFIGFRISLPIYIVSESGMPCCFGIFQVFFHAHNMQLCRLNKNSYNLCQIWNCFQVYMFQIRCAIQIWCFVTQYMAQTH